MIEKNQIKTNYIAQLIINQILNNHKIRKNNKEKKINAIVMDKKKQKSLVFTRKIRLVCLKEKLIFNHILT